MLLGYTWRRIIIFISIFILQNIPTFAFELKKFYFLFDCESIMQNIDLMNEMEEISTKYLQLKPE